MGKSALYGECIGLGDSARVRISSLANSGCNIEIADATLNPCAVLLGSAEAAVELWIGAVGPFAARLTELSGAAARAQFTEPLDARIVEHFASA